MSKAAVWSVIVAFAAGIIGSILTFVEPRLLAAAGLDVLTASDRILIGVLLLIIAAVAVYKLLTLVWEYEVPKKPSKSRKR